MSSDSFLTSSRTAGQSWLSAAGHGLLPGRVQRVGELASGSAGMQTITSVPSASVHNGHTYEGKMTQVVPVPVVPGGNSGIDFERFVVWHPEPRSRSPTVRLPLQPAADFPATGPPTLSEPGVFHQGHKDSNSLSLTGCEDPCFPRVTWLALSWHAAVIVTFSKEGRRCAELWLGQEVVAICSPTGPFCRRGKLKLTRSDLRMGQAPGLATETCSSSSSPLWSIVAAGLLPVLPPSKIKRRPTAQTLLPSARREAGGAAYTSQLTQERPWAPLSDC